MKFFALLTITAASLISCQETETPGHPQDYSGDLSIRFIQRTPAIDFVEFSPNPSQQGWPVNGSTVQWVGYIKNSSDQLINNLEYSWKLNGNIFKTGKIESIQANSEIQISVDWTWVFERNYIELRIDPNNKIIEREESNNALEVITNALSLGFYVEKSVYDYFGNHQAKLNVGSANWDDWAQRQVRIYNEIFESSSYQSSPLGVIDRFRIDKIVIVEDEKLPYDDEAFQLSIYGEMAVPNLADKSVDLQWGFPAWLLSTTHYVDHTTVSMDNSFYFESFVLHELLHGRYLIDNYNQPVYHKVDGSRVDINIGGKSIFEYLNLTTTGDFGDGPTFKLYDTRHKGLMYNVGLPTGQTTFKLSELCVMALNVLVGQRPRLNNHHPAHNLGVYMQQLPEVIELQILDENLLPIPSASVELFTASYPSSEIRERYPSLAGSTPKYFDNQVDYVEITNENGIVTFSGIIFNKYAFSLESIIVVKVLKDDKVAFSKLERADVVIDKLLGHELSQQRLLIKLMPL